MQQQEYSNCHSELYSSFTIQNWLKFCELEVEDRQLFLCLHCSSPNKRPLNYQASHWLYAEQRPEPFSPAVEATTRPTMRPYNPRASAKIKIKIMPTKRRDCCAFARTPASPTIPIAKPAAKELMPTVSPAPKCAYPEYAEY